MIIAQNSYFHVYLQLGNSGLHTTAILQVKHSEIHYSYWVSDDVVLLRKTLQLYQFDLGGNTEVRKALASMSC